MGAGMWSAHERDDGARSGNWFDDTIAVLTDERVDPAVGTRAGENVGGSTVEALNLAPEEEQQRTADQLEAATKMANAFLNLRYDEIEANVATVESLTTGPFRRQWIRATTDKRGLVALITRAQATQTGEVIWAGLVHGDDDDATVVIASQGTIANKRTDFEPQARTYRLQLDLDLVDGRWLTSDLQYVR